MKYDNPFPGMNPYLENSDIWPDFHNELIGQLRDVLGPQLPDRYRIALQRRVEVEVPLRCVARVEPDGPWCAGNERIRRCAASRLGNTLRRCHSAG